MDPTVQAAVIAGGSTAVVGVVGFWSTVRATGRQIWSAHEARVWDERAAVYVDVLAALGLFRRSDPDDPPEVDWNALSARVVAFGSTAVADAFANGLPTGAPDETPRAVSFGELAALIRIELQGKGADEGL